jgi:hypothetical protein
LIGASKYDGECQALQEATSGKLVLIMIVDGNKGNGIACRGLPSLIVQVPQLLRQYADQLEREGGMLLVDSPAGVSGGKVPPRRKQ